MTEYDHTPVTVAGKRAVVIGGTSGIGEAIALGFAADGADVIATSRTSERVERTADALRDRGAETAAVTCDVTDRASLERLRDAATDALGGVDVLVTSAGAVSREPLVSLPESEWARVIDVQLTGVYRACQLFAPVLGASSRVEEECEAEGGSVVTVSSQAAAVAMANLSAYTAAKGGVDAFTRAAARELAPEVRVNALSPGFVITPQNEDQYAQGTRKRDRIEARAALGRVADRGEMVGAAIYLASDAASYTTGEVLAVDGGFADGAF